MRGARRFPAVCLAVALLPTGLFAAGAPRRVTPFLHVSGAEEYCANSLINGCRERRFIETDLWLFQDLTASSTVAYKGVPGVSEGGISTPPTVRAANATVKASLFAALQELATAAAVPTITGDCNPLRSRPLIVPPSVVHYTIVYWGPGLQTNIVALSTDFADECPFELQELFTRLQDLATGIARAPTIAEPL
jgi:hypothetical protein